MAHALARKLTDLDYAILRLLPQVGARFGPHTYAKQVRTITEDVNATSPQVAGRLKSMKYSGVVTDVIVQPVQDGRGWQRTELGDSVLQAVGEGEKEATVHTLRPRQRAS
jgi:hypothetical protein